MSLATTTKMLKVIFEEQNVHRKLWKSLTYFYSYKSLHACIFKVVHMPKEDLGAPSTSQMWLKYMYYPN